MTTQLPAYGFWHNERDDSPFNPPEDMSPLEQKVFTALQIAFLHERAHSGAYVSFLNDYEISLDGKFRLDAMTRHIAAALFTDI